MAATANDSGNYVSSAAPSDAGLDSDRGFGAGPAPLARLARTSNSGETPAKVPRILVVDAECMILSLMELILRREGLDVRTAENGHEAVDLIQRDNGFSLTILDWHMPDTSGEQVFDQLVAICPSIMVIVLSGEHPSDVERAFSRRKVNCFLQKPFKIETLVTAVKSALSHPIVGQ